LKVSLRTLRARVDRARSRPVALPERAAGRTVSLIEIAVCGILGRIRPVGNAGLRLAKQGLVLVGGINAGLAGEGVEKAHVGIPVRLEVC
jgi:hypothetical protein